MSRKKYLIIAIIFNILSIPIYIFTVGIHGEFMGMLFAIIVAAPTITVSLLALIPAIRYDEKRGLKGLISLTIYALFMGLFSIQVWPLMIGTAVILGMVVDAFAYEKKMRASGVDIHATAKKSNLKKFKNTYK